ncbi:P-loop containing nucleoside triphosphate hydrolase protein [Bisporella sp. PMI_857]|nr:P-loop containing nucleoside triphosphate hydrolase protein [Bisporella sp. PMI_857]
MAPLCSTPLWRDGRFSDCFQGVYLSGIIPLTASLTSLVVLLVSHLYATFQRRLKNGYKFEPLAASGDETDTAKEVSTAQAVIRISSRTTVLEIILLIVDIGISLSLYIHNRIIHRQPLSLPLVVFSSYLLLLVLVRKWTATRSAHVYSSLRVHTTTLYSIQWLNAVALFYTAIVTRFGSEIFWNLSISIHLILFTILCLIHLLAPRSPLFQGTDQPPNLGRDETASLLSQLTYFWVDSLIWKAYGRTLEASDLYPLSRDRIAAVVIAKFRAVTDPTHPLLWRLFNFIKFELCKQFAWAFLESFMVFMPALLIRLLLTELEHPGTMIRSTAWLCVGGLFVAGLLTSLGQTQTEWTGRKISTRVRTVLSNDIYAKVLRKQMARSPQITPGTITTEGKNPKYASDGSILNLMSGDAIFISEMSSYLHMVAVMFPVQTTLAICLLYQILGISGIIGVFLMIALLPMNVILSRKMAAVQKLLLSASDARIQSSTELINNIRTIKYLGWEAAFEKRVSEKRAVELKRIRNRFIWVSINLTVFLSLPFIVTILTLFFYTVVWKNKLGTATAFPALVIFSIIKIPLNRLADSITFLLQTYVSVLRIDAFLNERDTGKYIQLESNDDSTIGFENATIVWPTEASAGNEADHESSSQPFSLRNLQLRFKPKALNVICGPTGSGKSSLLLALLGEMQLLSGRVFLPHERQDSSNHFFDMPTDTQFLSKTTAYCPQEPWILNRTIRENILFGQPFDGQRYDAVISSVALREDLIALDKGDSTLAGENGNRLSGGQKQRVSLARALYSRATHVLLDDCLSAVDARTANSIFSHAIQGNLMQDRTCILVTHNTQLAIPHSAYVVLLEEGQVKYDGTPADMVTQGLFVRASQDEAGLSKDTSELTEDIQSGEASVSKALQNDVLGGAEESSPKPNYTESKAEGAITWSTINSYLSVLGPFWYWVMLLFGFALQQLVLLGTNLWIKVWAYQYDNLAIHAAPGGPNREAEKVNAGYYLAIYALICFGYALATFFRDAFAYWGALNASSKIYARLLHSVLHAKLQFFDQVPLGQITNRFSNDVRALDMNLGRFSSIGFMIICSIVMIMIVISIVIPYFLIIAIFITIAYYLVATLYVSSSRDLKRIEAVSRSPLNQQLSETLSGAISIRAYVASNQFLTQNRLFIDEWNKPYNLLWAGTQWLMLRIGIIGGIISSSTGAFVLGNSATIDPGAAGLILTYAVTFVDLVMWSVQLYAMVQQEFNSMDRINEYMEIDQEASTLTKHASELASDWPTRGQICFESYTTRYAPELDPVLRNINFKVTAGSRIAIVGRTGAGKSSLTLSLIRGLEAETGRITIDDIDIASIPLERLRQTITVVPQDPTLFEGSIRDNLDPLQQYSDTDMLDLLSMVRLIDAADSESAEGRPRLQRLDLDHPATVLSRGQRQLLCIARALLRRSRILVLDEATASIDHAADALIQAGLRASVAAGTTVLTIAHRLQTIADYDEVVVLSEGQVVEQGKISKLLEHSGDGAVFRRLCEESGDLEGIRKAAVH